MKNSLSAIILSPTPVILNWVGWATLNHVRQFTTLEELHEQRLNALLSCTTEYCSYIDWDDDLPKDQEHHVEKIVQQMKEANANLTYTDWLECRAKDSKHCIPGPYNRTRHFAKPKSMHQLVMLNTEMAQKIARTLPLGLHHTETLLYYAMCKDVHPIYYPHVMYHWNRGRTGFHAHPNIVAAQTNSRNWLIQKGY
jgi:hypothetical protein